MARDGCNAKEISEAVQVSRTTASRVAKRIGIKLPPSPIGQASPPPTPEEIEERAAEIRATWTEGELHCRQAAGRVGIKQFEIRVNGRGIHTKAIG
jgi:transposase